MDISDSDTITDWLSGVENIPPPRTRDRPGKRKAERNDYAAPFKRPRTYDMPPRGKGQSRERRIPVNDAENNALPPPRRSSQSRTGSVLPAEASLATNIIETAPSLNYTSSSRRSQSTCTSNRSRSSSPRRVASLAALPEPITYINLDPYNSEQRVPAEVKRILARIRDYSKGRSILPQDMREEVRKDDKIREFDNDCFDQSDERKALGSAPPLARVEEIRSDTMICCESNRRISEAGWNCESQHPIGKLAWRRSVHRPYMRWENVTVADITPRSALMPATVAARMPDAARVDFAIVLEPSPKLKAALPFLEPLAGTEESSWGPTTMTAVAQRPFACVIETKRSGGNVEGAEYQIGIWAYAIFKRMRLLLDDNGFDHENLPCLPLLRSEGERWELHLAVQDLSNATSMWKIGDIGNALSCRGIYQIIAILQVVFDEAQTVFRPWFESHCLPQGRY